MADLDLELSESPLPTTATQSGAGVASSPQLKKAKTGTGSPGPQGEESLDGSVSVGVEKLEQDEFEFLDDVTRLAVLQSGNRPFLALFLFHTHAHSYNPCES